jgi:hypothetical protein
MKNLTEEGTILGTVQYMAPEQLEGAEADPRTDIFAFGMLLFEMITGRKAFEGKSRVSLMAAILEHPPRSISEIQPLTPPALDRLIRTCLEKNPDDRWQTAHDVELQLRWIEEGGSEVGLPAPVTRKRKGRERIAWLAAAAAAIAAVVLAFVGPLVGRAPAERRVVRTSIVSPAEARFNTGQGLALSPDGTKLVFAVDDEQGQRLYVRDLDDLESRVIEGSERGGSPFWSPDSAHIAFFVEDKLKRVTAAGETPQTICDAPGGRGGAWNDDGVIVFSRGSGSGRGRGRVQPPLAALPARRRAPAVRAADGRGRGRGRPQHDRRALAVHRRGDRVDPGQLLGPVRANRAPAVLERGRGAGASVRRRPARADRRPDPVAR